MFRDAKAYEQFMGRWSRLVAPLLADLAQVPDRGRVLDVGSGTGSLAFAIVKRKPHATVLGIDPSKEYVAYAASKNSFAGRAAFEVGDAQQLSYPNASFDAAVSLLVWNFIPDPGKALREVRRVTKSHGTISAAVWDYPAGMRMLRIFWDAAVSIDAAAEKRDEKHMPLCRSGELTQLWKQGGLQNVHEQPLEITTQFPSFTDYWDAFLLGQGPAGAYTVSLDRGKQQALRNELKRRLAISSEDQPFSLPARVWAVHGTVT
ncbi:MAG: class I SAM-dependent methyltransferase [Acidobacteriota bacterium]